MIKIALLILTIFLFTACVNKRGVTTKYYSDCDEYYDLQGYYHKDCDEENMVTYKSMKENATKATDIFIGKKKEEKPKGNVW